MTFFKICGLRCSYIFIVVLKNIGRVGRVDQAQVRPEKRPPLPLPRPAARPLAPRPPRPPPRPPPLAVPCPEIFLQVILVEVAVSKAYTRHTCLNLVE